MIGFLDSATSSSASSATTSSSPSGSTSFTSAIISAFSGVVMIKLLFSSISTLFVEKLLYTLTSADGSASLTYSVMSLMNADLNVSASMIASSFSCVLRSANCCSSPAILSNLLLSLIVDSPSGCADSTPISSFSFWTLS